MKKLVNKALATAVLASVLAGCASEEDSIVMSPVPKVENSFNTKSLWSTSVGDGVGTYFSKLKPLYSYEKVFVASRDGVVKALAPEKGDVIWKVELDQEGPARLSGGIASGYGQIFIGSENGIIYALDEQTGKINWQTKVKGEVLAAPTTDSNRVIIHSSNGLLMALDEASGELQWTINTDVPNLTLRGSSQPVTESGGVFWGTSNGRLAAAIVEQGQLIWQQPVGTAQGATEIDRLVDVDASPIILGSTLYIVGYNGHLIALDLRTGKQIWKRSYSSATDMVSDGSRLYLVTDKDHIVAVDARSGTELWKNSLLEYRLVTAPSLINDKIVVGDSEGYLYWLDRGTGEFTAKQNVDSSGFAVGPIDVPDGFIVTTRNGKVKKLTIND